MARPLVVSGWPSPTKPPSVLCECLLLLTHHHRCIASDFSLLALPLRSCTPSTASNGFSQWTISAILIYVRGGCAKFSVLLVHNGIFSILHHIGIIIVYIFVDYVSFLITLYIVNIHPYYNINFIPLSNRSLFH